MLARSAAPAPPAAIDYGVLVATLSAHQAASATARAALRAGTHQAWEQPQDALVELLAGGPGWREAKRGQRGSFNRAAAVAAVNRP